MAIKKTPTTKSNTPQEEIVIDLSKLSLKYQHRTNYPVLKIEKGTNTSQALSPTAFLKAIQEDKTLALAKKYIDLLKGDKALITAIKAA